MLNIIRFIKNKEKHDVLNKKFKAIGITVSGFEYLKPNVWQDIYNTLCDLYERYDFMPLGYLSEIRAYPKRTYFDYTLPEEIEKPEENDILMETNLLPKENNNLNYCTKHTIVIINADYIKNVNKYFKAIIEPENKVKYIITHEFGHIIDFYFSITLRYSGNEVNFIGYKALLKELRFSKQIVEQILSELNYSCEEVEIKMGECGIKSNTEILAETIALNDEGFKMDLTDKIYISFLNQIKR